ncbi:MAG TPA: DinB family protein, partial [Ignavibacteriaceae bacterium]|nr:DinB family protein [Ignavibacteriaceae bacterium]
MSSSHQIIQEYNKATQANIERAIKSFSYLSETQFNWKPQADKWSVGECISHLVKTNNLYLTKIESIFTLAAFGAEKDFH